MSVEPRISVIIPHYGQENFLIQALLSVARQRFRPHEVIVSDDASGSDIAGLLAPFRDKIPLQIITSEVNRGVSAARNRAIERATGDYLAFLDADDLWHPGHLALFSRCVAEEPIDFYSSGFAAFRNRKGIPHQGNPDPVCRQTDYFALAVKHSCTVNSSNVIIRKSAFEKAGLFNEDLPVFEDIDMWIRMGSLFPLTHQPAVTAFVRKDTPGSLTKRADYYSSGAVKKFFETHKNRLIDGDRKHFFQQNVLGTILHLQCRQRPVPAYLFRLLDPGALSFLERMKWRLPSGIFCLIRKWRQ